MNRRILLLLAGLLTPSLLAGQQSDFANWEIHPASITVLERDEIERWSPATLPELLRGLVPGVYSLDRGPAHELFGTIRLRGPVGFPACPTCLPKSMFRVVVDGVEVNSARLTSFPVHDLERVEIIPGPHGAHLHGADAERGVIRLYTRRASDADGVRVEGSATLGRADTPYIDESPLTRTARASLSGRMGGNGFSLGFQHDAAEGHVPGHSYAGNSASFGIRSQVQSIDVSGFVRLGERNVDDPGIVGSLYELYLDGLVGPADRALADNRAAYRHLTAGLTLGYSPATNWRIEFTAGEDVLDLEFRSFPAPESSDSLVRDEADRLLLPNAHLTARGEMGLSETVDLLLGGGIDARWSDWSRRESVYWFRDQAETLNWRGSLLREDHSSSGGHGSIGLRLLDRVMISGGLRVDRHSLFGPDAGQWVVTPRAGATWGLRPGDWEIMFRAGWAEALGAPTRSMLTGIAPDILPNSAIEPQTTSGIDIGVRAQRAAFSLDLSGYDQHTEGAIGPTEDGQYVNFEGVMRNRGADAVLAYRGASTDLRGIVSWFYNEVEHRSPTYPVEPMPNDPYPELMLQAEGEQSLSPWLGIDAHLGARWFYLGRRWATDLRGIHEAAHSGVPVEATHRWFDPAARIDLRAAAGVGRGITLGIEVRNAANSLTHEVPGYVTRGREIRLRVSAGRGD